VRSLASGTPNVAGKPERLGDVAAVEALVGAFSSAWNKADIKGFSEH
jgi:hypothetical protein